ncbi:MAG: hypothetical protein AM325_007155 [Candidatus Thorarchaeota archaeon SMTZ1-45]|nr:MAG: hypothetical protein AM325_08885 [Candidatus Thorarchaeota archaeon SMTZ1-45]
MKHVNMKMILGLIVSIIFLLGAFAAPVSAVQTNIKIEKYNQGYASGTNNHTYMYIEPDPLKMVSRGTMHLNEDLDYTTYTYDGTGWTSPDSSLFKDTNVQFNWLPFSGWSTGPFANPVDMPVFFDFTATDGSDFVVNTTLEMRTFGLTFGQHTAVLADAGYTYFGTLGVGGEEFVHLTVESKQDDISWFILVYDPEGRYITGYSGSDGNIWTIPFKPSGPGTHYIILHAFPGSGTFGLFDFLPVAISPQAISADGVVTGNLPSSEFVLDPETGSFVYREMAPTVHTYKVSSPDDVASISYAFNYPIGSIGPPQPVSIRFTSGEFHYGYDGGNRYEYVDGSPATGVYFFRGGPYYVTVVGGDGTEYTLYHQANSYGVLPTNREFQFENYMGATVTQAYTLDVDEPSLLRVNSTATSGELSIRLRGLYEDGYRVDRTLTFDTNMLSSSEYYLPVGVYFVEMEIDNGVNEWVEFNMGPIVSDTNTQIVDVGGFFVDTEIFQMYNMTIFLNNQDNVTVGLDVTIYDASGRALYSAGMVLANRWDGSQIVPHPVYWANDTFYYTGHDWYDSHAFVGICAYLVDNNTVGATNNYQDYPVDLTIQWVSRLNDYYVTIEDLDVATGSASHNFLLPAPGGSNEIHGLMLNTTPGTWYNVSVMTDNVTGFNAVLYSAYDGRTHQTPWGDLNDEYVGSVAEFSFQFGAVSDYLFLELDITRTPANDGFLWIQITPMETYPLLVEGITPLGPDLLAMLGGIAIPAAIGVGVIVVVYIVYVKRFKK